MLPPPAVRFKLLKIIAGVYRLPKTVVESYKFSDGEGTVAQEPGSTRIFLRNRHRNEKRGLAPRRGQSVCSAVFADGLAVTESS
jgi:hypothetical protein